MAPASTARSKSAFDPGTFLVTIGEATKPVLFPKKETIFAQGGPADAVFYLQTGKIRLTVLSKTGKEATIGILSDGSFFGEGALAHSELAAASAAAS
jgi:CRP/FNR family transcriptional regulator, cyclic AMP receptor protein